jgi:hypothetical protein
MIILLTQKVPGSCDPTRKAQAASQANLRFPWPRQTTSPPGTAPMDQADFLQIVLADHVTGDGQAYRARSVEQHAS